MQHSLKAVIVDSDVSFPATSGKRLRTLNLMVQMAKRHRIIYLARSHGDREQLIAAEEFLKDHGIESMFVEHRLPRKSGPLFYGRLAANLLSRLPYSVVSHRSRPIDTAAQLISKAGEIDVWQLEWGSSLDSIRRHSPNIVLNAHNVESSIWQRSAEVASNPWTRFYLAQQWKKFERFEASAYRQCKRVIAVSEHDAELMAQRFGFPSADVVPNGVDIEKYAPADVPRDPNQVLLVGALDWRPNQDGLHFLLNEIWPLVRNQYPAAKLSVVGRSPPRDLEDRLRREPGVTLHANVPDVVEHLHRAAIMVVPLRIGGGSRLKILEALAAKLPVISTSVGAEGLDLQPHVHYQQADCAESLATEIVKTLNDAAHGRRLAETGHEVVRSKYDWSVLADALDRVWRACAEKKSTDNASSHGEAADLALEHVS